MVSENEVMILENRNHNDFVKYLEANQHQASLFDDMLEIYRVGRKFPDLHDFRLGPNKFDQIPLNWIICKFDDAEHQEMYLLGHGVTTGINWSGKPEDLPEGWHGSVRKSYMDSVSGNDPCNTLVGLFIHVIEDARNAGIANQIILIMKEFAKKKGYSHFIIPLRPPLKYNRKFVEMDLNEFANLYREDGQHKDHWIRLHLRLGASIIGVCNTSHRHAMSIADFYQIFRSETIRKSGFHLIESANEWYRAYADLARDIVLLDQGCVWVEHTL